MFSSCFKIESRNSDKKMTLHCLLCAPQHCESQDLECLRGLLYISTVLNNFVASLQKLSCQLLTATQESERRVYLPLTSSSQENNWVERKKQ